MIQHTVIVQIELDNCLVWEKLPHFWSQKCSLLSVNMEENKFPLHSILQVETANDFSKHIEKIQASSWTYLTWHLPKLQSHSRQSSSIICITLSHKCWFLFCSLDTWSMVFSLLGKFRSFHIFNLNVISPDKVFLDTQSNISLTQVLWHQLHESTGLSSHSSPKILPVIINFIWQLG